MTYCPYTILSGTYHSVTVHSLVTIMLFCFVFQVSFAQNDTIHPPDTLEQKSHSPRKATIFSSVLPGLGQAYNKKYWKIPIIYAGFGAFAYFISQNSFEYKKFKEAYIWKVSNDTTPIDNDYIYKYLTSEQLKAGKDYYLRNLELSWIFCGIWYILNILDAAVDAQLMDFDISEDISLHVEPGLKNNFFPGYQPVAGMTLTLNFR
ncbi:MAG: DUF5683 domain-containing protein [Bacteroidetes bacterium]|nr:DUF5683 domain-containing protein [Bacteroidota bacterium]